MPTATGEGRFIVEIDETILAPLRAAFGDDQNRLFLLGWRRFRISVDASIRLNRQLPVGFFSNSWELFHVSGANCRARGAWQGLSVMIHPLDGSTN